MYWAIDFDDYNRDPEWAEWTEITEGWVSSLEDAARHFMETDCDPHGSFGSRQTAQRVVVVMVFDTETEVTHVLEVTPNPMPGYAIDSIDATDAMYDHQIDLEKAPRPNAIQIPE